MATHAAELKRPRFPILALLHPREQTAFVAGTVALGIGLGWAEMRWLGWPLWGAAATMLLLLMIPGMAKWRADARRYGPTAMGLSILLAAQGFHSVEHVAQWLQFHVLNWSARASTGLLSPANAEWVHFTWNWIVLLIVIGLLRGGVRNAWAWLLLAWALAHTLEHTYMFARYLAVLDDLRRMGVTNVSAQGLPGVLGRDGWLARSAATQGSFLCRLPGLTTANRLDVHFWWNAGELALLLLAAHFYLGSTLRQRPLNASSR
ncbi:MAG TPA: hypothetical protein VF897_25570 [Roseiflexaceae bacterium]